MFPVQSGKMPAHGRGWGKMPYPPQAEIFFYELNPSLLSIFSPGMHV
jgi:hypothetical protein